jgi:predicted RecB family endonuclease
MAASPTSRTLDWLRKQGFLAAVVEKRVPFRNITQDLWGFVDILAVKDGETYGIQCTSGSNVASRVKKVAASEHLPRLREAEWVIWVIGWRKNAAGRWVSRVVDVS